MSFKICIPSYKRSSILLNKTLAMLAKHNMPLSSIFIFVADDVEYNNYKNVIMGDYTIIIGEPGLVQQRAFIESYFEEGTNILFLDDDIDSVDGIVDINEFITNAFTLCRERGAYIWGIYPCNNPFFRCRVKDEISYGLKYIVGAFYGIINRPHLDTIKLQITPLHNSIKEDVERTVLYYKNDGIVIRFNRIGLKTRYYGTDGGGLGIFSARVEPSRIVSNLLHETYPEYGRVKCRKNGMYEFVLKIKG